MSRPPTPVAALICWLLVGGVVVVINLGNGPILITYGAISFAGEIAVLTWAYLTDRKDRP